MAKNKLLWCSLCIFIFLVSIFIHECGHGFANSLCGIACSTGFNRVGDIYKYPGDADFRAEYSLAPDGLLDFGVPATLILAIAGSIMAYRLNGKGKIIALGIAVTNSVLRLIPCLFVIVVPLFTGNVHKEDEYATGLMLAEMTGCSWLLYFPAVVSILISVICIICIYRRVKTEISFKEICRYGLLTLLSFYITMIIANVLDNIIRINWPVLS